MKHFLMYAMMALWLSWTHSFAIDYLQRGDDSQIAATTKNASGCGRDVSGCGNSETEEAPQDISIRDARRARASAAAAGDDKLRWKRSLYSDSIQPKDLEVELIRAAGFGMRLFPVTGQLRFTQPGAIHTFEIEQPLGTANSLCPRYAINVVTASKFSAIVRKSCNLNEYQPGRFSLGATYYLFDSGTHAMRTIWQSQTSGKNDPFPDPSEEPKMTTVADGIKIIWRATYPADGEIRRIAITTHYERQITGGQVELVCKDLSVLEHENVEVGACEGGKILRVLGSAPNHLISPRN